MKLIELLLRDNMELSDKQINCMIMVFDRIIKNHTNMKDYFLLSEDCKRIYFVEVLDLEESFWAYIIKKISRYEKLIIFS